MFTPGFLSNSKIRNLGGFTMIEILIVIATVSILSAAVLLYGRQSESQLILFKEQSRLVSEIYRAKAFSVETYNESSVPCGFGIHFTAPRTYVLYKDIAADCSLSNKSYSSLDTDEVVTSNTLDAATSFGTLPVSDILFVPPDPTVFIDGVANFSGTAVIAIISEIGARLNVKINGAGQISI